MMKWRMLRWFFITLGVAITVIFATLFVGLVVVFTWKPKYDDHDPRLASLGEQISDAATAFSGTNSSPIVLDFGGLNGGDWSTACVYGGYSNPSREMLDLGATVSPADRTRLAEARTRNFRAAEVEETEAMIAYIDASRDAHFLHLASGFGQYSDFGKQCVSKPETLMRLR